jgi:hypothetical protein
VVEDEQALNKVASATSTNSERSMASSGVEEKSRCSYYNLMNQPLRQVVERNVGRNSRETVLVTN